MKEILSKEFESLKNDLIKAYDQKGMRASGKFAESLEVTATDYEAILKGEDYSQQLESGRNSGKQPPIESIKQWILDKGVFTAILQEIKLSSLAFLIARKIGKEGWKREGYGGVNLISEVVTEERIQKIINEVGEQQTIKFTSEILELTKQLSVA